MSFKGALFDLDGVIVNTVPLHFKAWKTMFGEYGKEFTFEDYQNKVDGIPRVSGAKAILTDLDDDEIKKACDKKQEYFLKHLGDEGIDVYETTMSLINELKQNDIKIIVISSSKNCPYILDKIGLSKILDGVISGTDVAKGKPDPEIFLTARDKLGLQSSECVVFEDAFLGVEAGKRANMFTIGIDRHNDPERLKKADLVIKDLGEVDYNKLKELLR